MADKPVSISAITVRGFKSIADEQTIDIAPLTVLAGANSSGKSSIMQPLLLLKQTLDSTSDPGALLLDGPNVRFTSTEQLLSKTANSSEIPSFSITLKSSDLSSIVAEYQFKQKYKIDIVKTVYNDFIGNELPIRLNMSPQDIKTIQLGYLKKLSKYPEIADSIYFKNSMKAEFFVSRNRCFLCMASMMSDMSVLFKLPIISPCTDILKSIIHLPGLRGNPRRTYPVSGVGPQFPGAFDAYVASLIFKWQSDNKKNINILSRQLEKLGLTWKIRAKPIDDTQVEIQVGRMPRSKKGGANDVVSVADVGFGVSQVLPALVAMLAAQPGQLVYLEQPEIHLHPRAQRLLAPILCETAKRGVKLVIETHSALLLREILTQIAKGNMPKEDVRLHWFKRGDDGATTIKTANLDDNGGYGDWPADFDETELDAEKEYLDAVELRINGQ